MNRRKFIKSIGAVAGAGTALCSAASAGVAHRAVAQLTAQQIAQIRSSIHANFGSGFQMLSCETLSGETTSVITQHGNTYLVSSTDLMGWDIVKATVM